MHFVEILGSKSKQQNNKNFNEIALIFRYMSMPSRELTAFTKSFTNNKKQDTSLKLLLKVSNKVTEPIQNF